MEDESTCWQSNGGAGQHNAIFELSHTATLTKVEFLQRCSLDGNYSPADFEVEVGDSEAGLALFAEASTEAHNDGWVVISNNSVSCSHIKVRIKRNHDDGIDCKVRGIRFSFARGRNSGISWTDGLVSIYRDGGEKFEVPKGFAPVSACPTAEDGWSYKHDVALATFLSEKEGELGTPAELSSMLSSSRYSNPNPNPNPNPSPNPNPD